MPVGGHSVGVNSCSVDSHNGIIPQEFTGKPMRKFMDQPGKQHSTNNCKNVFESYLFICHLLTGIVLNGRGLVNLMNLFHGQQHFINAEIIQQKQEDIFLDILKNIIFSNSNGNELIFKEEYLFGDIFTYHWEQFHLLNPSLRLR